MVEGFIAADETDRGNEIHHTQANYIAFCFSWRWTTESGLLSNLFGGKKKMKTKRFGTGIFIVVILLLASACGAKEYKPQAINEETDKCVICNMAVKDDPYATQIILTDGQSLKFDDIGCMNEWKVQNGSEGVGAEFVRDHNSGDWIKYEKAFYAYDSAYITPMAYGVIAFEDKASAQAYITEQGMGKLLSSEELAEHKWEVNREMMDMEDMEMHNENKHSDDSKEEMDMGHGTEGKSS